jgi:hypothetical protein
VIFNHSLEHIPRPTQALGIAACLLRPSGRLFVVVPNFGCWQRRVFRSSWFHLDVPRHLQHFDAKTLVSTLSCSGLQSVRVRTFSSLNGLPGSIQFQLFGRWVLPRGAVARAVAGAAFRLGRVTELVGEGDHLVASGVPARRGGRPASAGGIVAENAQGTLPR